MRKPGGEQFLLENCSWLIAHCSLPLTFAVPEPLGGPLERWQSGRMRRFRKPLYRQRYRGFESPLLYKRLFLARKKPFLLLGTRLCRLFLPREVAEWSIAAVLKTADCNRSGGSNPSFSAPAGGQCPRSPPPPGGGDFFAPPGRATRAAAPPLGRYFTINAPGITSRSGSRCITSAHREPLRESILRKFYILKIFKCCEFLLYYWC